MFKKSHLLLISLFLISLFSVTTFAGVVNINTSDAAALQQYLVGVGPVKAEAIIKYRSENGAFKSIDDLKNVTGIGDALVKLNKSSISLNMDPDKRSADEIKDAINNSKVGDVEELTKKKKDAVKKNKARMTEKAAAVKNEVIKN